MIRRSEQITVNSRGENIHILTEFDEEERILNTCYLIKKEIPRKRFAFLFKLLGIKNEYQYLYHNISGPAESYSDGWESFCLYDEEYTKDEWFAQLTPEERAEAIWNF